MLITVLERELEESDNGNDSDGLEEIVDYGEYVLLPFCMLPVYSSAMANCRLV